MNNQPLEMDTRVKTTYRATVLTGKGGPEVLAVKELALPEPGPGEVRVRASGVGSTDVIMRRGSYPYAPKIPFAPGYEVVGDGEVVVRRAEEFVPVPDGLDDADVVVLILNYVTAFQMIERVAKPHSGQLALVTGANGGIGTALLELLASGQIHPKIAARLPLLEARRGNEMLEAGDLEGKIVLLAPGISG